MLKYKDTYYNKSSFLAAAIEEDEALIKRGKKKEAKHAEKCYNETTKRMKELYDEEDLEWLSQKCKGMR